MRDSLVIFDAYFHRPQLCVSSGERVRVTLEAPDLDAAAMAGSFLVDVQLAGAIEGSGLASRCAVPDDAVRIDFEG